MIPTMSVPCRTRDTAKPISSSEFSRFRAIAIASQGPDRLLAGLLARFYLERGQRRCDVVIEIEHLLQAGRYEHAPDGIFHGADAQTPLVLKQFLAQSQELRQIGRVEPRDIHEVDDDIGH